MFEAAVVGTSAGGFRALQTIIPALPAAFPLSIAIVQHLDAHADSYLAEHLQRLSAMRVKEAEDKESLAPGTAYLAPAGYHLLIEPDKSFSLSVDDKVRFSRPSIDLLFESAADAYGQSLIGVLLTGANADGARGLEAIKRHGGLVIVQNPMTADAPYMPRAGLATVAPDYLENLEDIGPLLLRLGAGETYGIRTQS